MRLNPTDQVLEHATDVIVAPIPPLPIIDPKAPRRTTSWLDMLFRAVITLIAVALLVNKWWPRVPTHKDIIALILIAIAPWLDVYLQRHGIRLSIGLSGPTLSFDKIRSDGKKVLLVSGTGPSLPFVQLVASMSDPRMRFLCLRCEIDRCLRESVRRLIVLGRKSLDETLPLQSPYQIVDMLQQKNFIATDQAHGILGLIHAGDDAADGATVPRVIGEWVLAEGARIVTVVSRIPDTQLGIE